MVTKNNEALLCKSLDALSNQLSSVSTIELVG